MLTGGQFCFAYIFYGRCSQCGHWGLMLCGCEIKIIWMRSAQAIVICKEIAPEATIEEYSSKLDIFALVIFLVRPPVTYHVCVEK